jgi:hypothetical protein
VGFCECHGTHSVSINIGNFFVSVVTVTISSQLNMMVVNDYNYINLIFSVTRARVIHHNKCLITTFKKTGKV